MVKCWESLKCEKTKCPAYESESLQCWLVSGTHCRDEIQGKFFEKMEVCLECQVFTANMDISSMKETTRVVAGQLKDFHAKIVESLAASMQKEKELSAVNAAAAAAEKRRAIELDAFNQQLRASEQHLKAANQQLAAKEEELRRKISELERFNKIMIGRELEMIKLKGEINSLLVDLGKEIKYNVKL